MDSWWKALKIATSWLLSGVLLKLAVSVWKEWLPPYSPATFLDILSKHISLVSCIVASSIPCALLWLLAARKEALENLENLTFFKPSRNLKAEEHMSLSGFNDYFQPSAEATKAQQELSTKGKVLIVGRPAGGKTRLAYSLAKQNEKYWVLRLPADFDKSESLVFSRIPPRCKVLWIIDNLNEFAVGKIDFVHVMDSLKRQCDLKIIAACREGKELDSVRADKELAAFVEPLLPGISCHIFNNTELLELAGKTGKPLDLSRYDGTPGSVTLGLQDMKQRLQNANSEEQKLMKAMFLFRTALIYKPSEELAISVFSKIYKLEPAEEKVEAAVINLKRDGFVREGASDKSEDHLLVPAHDCYLTTEFFRYYPAGGRELEKDLLALGKIADTEGTGPTCKSLGIFWSDRKEYARALPFLQKAACRWERRAI